MEKLKFTPLKEASLTERTTFKFVDHLFYSHSSEFLGVVGGAGETLEIFRSSTMKSHSILKHTYRNGTVALKMAAISENDETVLGVGHRHIVVFDRKTGKPLFHALWPCEITVLTQSLDGNYLFLGTADGKVVRIPSNKMLSALEDLTMMEPEVRRKQ